MEPKIRRALILVLHRWHMNGHKHAASPAELQNKALPFLHSCKVVPRAMGPVSMGSMMPKKKRANNFAFWAFSFPLPLDFCFPEAEIRSSPFSFPLPGKQLPPKDFWGSRWSLPFPHPRFRFLAPSSTARRAQRAGRGLPPSHASCPRQSEEPGEP